jgi:hypothetical protein
MSTDTDTLEMHALALRTAQRIEAEAAAINLLEEHAGTWWGDTDKEDREAIREARELLELDAFIPNTDAATDVADGLEDLRDRLRFEGPLSIRRRGYNDGNGWETDEVEIVLGTGGPHVQVEYRGDSATVTALGWFGAGKTSLPVDAAAVETVYGVDYLYQDEDQ